MVENLISEDMAGRALLHLGVSLALWLLVIIAILLDLWDGVYTAKKLHQRVHSHKLRVTVSKISEYWRLMLIGFIIDSVGVLLPFYAMPYVSMVLCIGLICVEAKSMFEHAKKRKSSTLRLQEIFRMAIDCASEAEAMAMLRKFGEYLDSTELKPKAAVSQHPSAVPASTVLNAAVNGHRVESARENLEREVEEMECSM